MRLNEAASGDEVLGVADGLQGGDALDGIHQIVRARGESGIDFVVGETAPLAQDVARALEQEIEHLLLDGFRCFDLRRVAPSALSPPPKSRRKVESGSCVRE